MVETQQITPTQFLEMYSRRALVDPVNVKVGTEQRVYGRTTEGKGETYKVVYCVV